MALDASSLIVTVGAANANSYVTLAEAQAYHDLKLNAEAWFDAEPDDKLRALVEAARRLQRETWLGSPVTSAQSLAWPRAGVAKADGLNFGAGWYSGWPGGYGREAYLPTEIPQPVKDAQCELALALLAGWDEEGERITEYASDGLSVKKQSARPAGSLPARVAQLIGRLVTGAQSVRG